MKRTKTLFASAAFALALFAPIFTTAGASAAEIEPCVPDLAMSKQVKVPGGSFVSSPDQASAPTTSVDNTVDWQLTVTKATTGTCDGVGISGTVLVHDTLPAGFSYVSSVGDGSYSSSTNDWTFNANALNFESSVTIVITTTANQAGTFENVAALTSIVFQGEQEPVVVSYGQSGDQNSENDSANAWVNIQKPQVLAASTLAETGNSALVNIAVGVSLIVAVAALSIRRKHYRN